MKAVIVRSSEKNCEPNCPEWIMLEGQITEQSPTDFRIVLERVGERKLPVILNSPGGNVLGAVQIGMMINRAGLATAVGRTSYKGCGPFTPGCKEPAAPDGRYLGRVTSRRAFCFSACPLILAGGASRLADKSTRVGVHQIVMQLTGPQVTRKTRKRADSKLPTRPLNKQQAMVLSNVLKDYLNSMGVSLALLDDMKKASATSMYTLSPRRRKELKLITTSGGAEKITSKAICANPDVASNCVAASAPAKPGERALAYDEALVLAGVLPMDKPMTVVMVRDSNKGCEPVCPQFIAAHGVITADTPKQFAKVLASAGSGAPPVLIDSPGGDLDAALEIGRMIGKRKLPVMVGNVHFVGCKPGQRLCSKPPANGIYKGYAFARDKGCNGVCALVLAGGSERLVPRDEPIVLHNPNIYVSRSAPEQSVAKLKRYLKGNESGPALLAYMDLIGGNQSKQLTGAAAIKLKLATSNSGAAEFLRASLCKQDQLPGFCVRRN
jgi:hypothetical protein